MEKQEIIDKINAEIKTLNTKISENVHHGERINTYIIAKSNYYIALSNLIKS